MTNGVNNDDNYPKHSFSRKLTVPFMMLNQSFAPIETPLIREINRQTTDWGKISVICMPDKGSLCRIYKNLKSIIKKEILYNLLTGKHLNRKKIQKC